MSANCVSKLVSALLACAIFQATAAHASIYTASGTWVSSPITGEGFEDQAFSGSASFSYDTSALTGTGTEYLKGSLTTFSQTPAVIGGTTFDLTNTEFMVEFVNGVRGFTVVGVSVGPYGTSFSADDFVVLDRPNTSSDSFVVSDGDEDTAPKFAGATVSFVHTLAGGTVPEPTAFLVWGLLFGLILTGIKWRRARA